MKSFEPGWKRREFPGRWAANVEASFRQVPQIPRTWVKPDTRLLKSFQITAQCQNVIATVSIIAMIWISGNSFIDLEATQSLSSFERFIRISSTKFPPKLVNHWSIFTTMLGFTASLSLATWVQSVETLFSQQEISWGTRSAVFFSPTPRVSEICSAWFTELILFFFFTIIWVKTKSRELARRKEEKTWSKKLFFQFKELLSAAV